MTVMAKDKTSKKKKNRLIALHSNNKAYEFRRPLEKRFKYM